MNRKQVYDYLMMKRDGRNPYGSRGGYVDSARDMRGGYDRNGRDYLGGNMQYDTRRGDRAYSQQDNARYGSNNQYDRQSDMARGRDGHYMGQGSTYYPIEAMGTFNGYYGMPNQDYARNDMAYRNDGHYDPVNNREVFEYDMQRNYDMRGRSDYGFCIISCNHCHF